MDKQKLAKYKTNKRELSMLDLALKKLYNRLDEVPEVSGKVTKSGKEFPYIKGHMTVKVAEPKAAAVIKRDIQNKEKRVKVLQKEIEEVEQFIDQLPEGEIKRIFELTYLEGMRQQDVGDIVGLERSSISKKIDTYLQLSHNSQK